MTSTPALRARKKIATRAALANAALELADQHGLSRLRIEDIAEHAGVSLRTFRNYYPNKEAAVVGLLTHNYDLVVRALSERPDDEPIWPALANACATLYPEDPDRAWVRRMRLLKAEPALAAEKYRSDSIALESLEGQIAERLASAGSDLFPRLVAEVTQAALRAATDYWLDTPDTPPLRDVVRDFIARISIESNIPIHSHDAVQSSTKGAVSKE